MLFNIPTELLYAALSLELPRILAFRGMWLDT